MGNIRIWQGKEREVEKIQKKNLLKAYERFQEVMESGKCKTGDEFNDLYFVHYPVAVWLSHLLELLEIGSSIEKDKAREIINELKRWNLVGS